jgi:hypothetical protein
MANTVNDNFNVYQKTNNEIIEKGIDTTNKYQQETINTIQSISNNNPIELQKISLILINQHSQDF